MNDNVCPSQVEAEEEKEQILEAAIKNLEEGLPPTEDSEMAWDRQTRNAARREIEGEERRQRKLLE